MQGGGAISDKSKETEVDALTRLAQREGKLGRIGGGERVDWFKAQVAG